MAAEATVPKPVRWTVMPRKRNPETSLVLVVEDDDLVRMMAVEMLEDAGFAVVEARQADEAWFVLHERSDIGVLFTDVDMPGSMCGVALAERVHEAWPDIRLVLTSGRNRFADRDVPDHGLFVAKPYSASQVVEAIHHAD
jgi:CheY-like chemotaxis protein